MFQAGTGASFEAGPLKRQRNRGLAKDRHALNNAQNSSNKSVTAQGKEGRQHSSTNEIQIHVSIMDLATPKTDNKLPRHNHRGGYLDVES